MMDNNGNRWVEENYDGYGEFGGKDYYELLAEMNGLGSDKSLGIELAFKGNPSDDNTEGVIYPNLVEYPSSWVFNSKGPQRCEFQGYFYPEDEFSYDEDYEEEY